MMFRQYMFGGFLKGYVFYEYMGYKWFRSLMNFYNFFVLYNVLQEVEDDYLELYFKIFSYKGIFMMINYCIL